MARPFTIALPVRNGGHYLRLCVESILAQTCGDFDLVILDNASDDEGADWLRTVRDPRVSIVRSERSLSIEENWARILHVSKREFLTTIGHDDLLHPEFLEVISRLIRAQPDAGLYATHFRIIDSDGALLRPCWPVPAHETAAEFVAARLCDLRDTFGTGYVLRSAAYDALGGIPAFPKLMFADDALFVQAIGQSYKATAIEDAFSYRSHATSASMSSAMATYFRGFEAYAAVLARLQQSDPALGIVLSRHFAACAVRVGQRWRQEAMLAAYQQHMPLDPAVDQRLAKLVTLFGQVPPALLPVATLTDRLLEQATRSRAGRVLFDAWRAQQKSRAIVTRYLGSRLRSKSAGRS